MKTLSATALVLVVCATPTLAEPLGGPRDARQYSTGAGTVEDPYLGWQAAVAPDTKVVLSPGSVYGLAADLRLPAGSVIECTDRSAVILFLADGVAITNEPNAGGISLRHCTIDANGDRWGKKPRNSIEFVTGTGQGYVFENLEVRAATKAGIKVLGTRGIPTHVTVAHCVFKDQHWHGVDFAAGVSHSEVVGCEFIRTNQTTEGASIYFSDDSCDSNQAIDNRVDDSGDNGIRIKGSHNVVRGNAVHLGRTDGIRDEGVGTTVADNTIRAPDEVCIKIGRGARDSTVDDNKCIDSGRDNDGNRNENGHGILTYTDHASQTVVDRAAITRNYVLRPGGDCIHLESASPVNATTNALVQDNTCVDAGGAGIRATRGSTYHISRNRVVRSRLESYSLAGRQLRASKVRRRSREQ